MDTFKDRLQEKIDAALRVFDDFARYGGVCHDISGKYRPSVGKALCRLCSVCASHPSAGDFCRHAAVSGAYHSFAIGDVHMSRCWLGLHFLVAPIAPHGEEVLGAFEVGGILFAGELQRVQHDMMAKLSALDSSDRLSTRVNSLQGLDEATALDIENLKVFMRETMFSCGLLDPTLFEANRTSWRRQQRLSDVPSVTSELAFGEARRRAVGLANRLLEVMESGDVDDVEYVSGEILGNAVLAVGGAELGGVDGMRPFLLPAVSAVLAELSRGGMSWSACAVLMSKWMEEMGSAGSVDELCSWFGALCCKTVSGKGSGEKFGDIRKTLSERLLVYLNEHFRESLRIESVAKRLGLSPSSLMHKVKEETGSTFSRLLNEARIREAKRLLAFTSLPIGEIASRCGFKDQSYFTKVFYGVVNIKPREFRGMLAGMTP